MVEMQVSIVRIAHSVSAAFYLIFFFCLSFLSSENCGSVSFIFMDYCSDKNLGEKNSFVLWFDGADML